MSYRRKDVFSVADIIISIPHTVLLVVRYWSWVNKPNKAFTPGVVFMHNNNYYVHSYTNHIGHRDSVDVL